MPKRFSQSEVEQSKVKAQQKLAEIKRVEERANPKDDDDNDSCGEGSNHDDESSNDAAAALSSLKVHKPTPAQMTWRCLTCGDVWPSERSLKSHWRHHPRCKTAGRYRCFPPLSKNNTSLPQKRTALIMQEGDDSYNDDVKVLVKQAKVDNLKTVATVHAAIPPTVQVPVANSFEVLMQEMMRETEQAAEKIKMEFATKWGLAQIEQYYKK